jgi:RNA ligase (TIGR02306 family)
MGRKLASIQKVRTLGPIEGADSIEKATILGWTVVVRKGDFKVGDLCVYCEIDSILPEWPEFEFLRAKKFKIKTIKLRGQVSQGIAFPLKTLDKYIACKKEFTDVTDALNVTKWEPVSGTGSYPALGNFPYFVPKTSEIRVKTTPEVLERHRDKTFYITEKLDGTSGTYFYKDEEDKGFASRNVWLKPGHASVYENVESKYWVLEKLKELVPYPAAVQGEIVGPKIAGNPYKLPKQELYLFNLYNIDAQCYSPLDDLLKFSDLSNIPMVPVLDREAALPGTIAECVAMAGGPSVLNKNVRREGLVFRSIPEAVDVELGRLSFKIISEEFLLRKNRKSR